MAPKVDAMYEMMLEPTWGAEVQVAIGVFEFRRVL